MNLEFGWKIKSSIELRCILVKKTIVFNFNQKKGKKKKRVTLLSTLSLVVLADIAILLEWSCLLLFFI